MARVWRQWRILGTAAFLLAAIAPLGAWGIYLFAVTPELWRHSLDAALSAENEYRSVFVFMAIAGFFSAVAVGVMVLARRRSVFRALLVAAIAQVGLYAAFGAWFLALVAAMPVWCVYMVKNEV